MKCLRETFPCHANKIYSGIVAAIADAQFETAQERVARSCGLYFCILYVKSKW